MSFNKFIIFSLSSKTLFKLVELKTKTCKNVKSDAISFGSLSESFDAFKLAHDLVDSVEAVKLATQCVIDDFNEEKVVYLEIRSTPRDTVKMTKLDCLQTIIDTIM